LHGTESRETAGSLEIAFGVTCADFPDILPIFDMRVRSRILPQILGVVVFVSASLRADPGDVEGSHDYPGFPRPPGFIISDYDEDNPAEFDFPVARPVPDDANHVEIVEARGHRYAVRYELGPGGRPAGLFQTQQYYEKLAARAGFTVEKTGAVGDVTETFYRETPTQQIWVYLEPAITVNVVTVVEATEGAAPPPLHPAVTTVATPAPAPAVPEAPPPAEPEPVPDLNPDQDDSLFTDLNDKGRVVVPFVFQPGRDELDASSQPLIDRVVAMMKLHPEIFLRIEGHTDNSGDPDDNMRLSAQRALAVENRLIAAHIDKKRLDYVGVGGLQPLASNDTAEGREKNRRIELVLWKKSPAFHAPAPNGQNYYPNPGSSTAGSRAGL
jgi:outer membrane protein OmpA-like peptidoglycan-associated protein